MALTHRLPLPSPAARLFLARLSHSDLEPSLHLHHPTPPRKPPRDSAFARFAQRLQSAYDRIRSKHLPPEVRAAASHAVRSEEDVANVVEHRIWHSMLEGDFENLPGKGKPLVMPSNPHADPAEDLLYRILAKNGFAPEWVELNKEIRFLINRWRRALQLAWKRKDPLNGDKARVEAVWRADLQRLEEELKDINRKVFHYNLIVPFGRQVFFYKMKDELQQLQNCES